MFKQRVSKLLNTEMDRKQFLKTVLVTSVALTGATTILKTVASQVSNQTMSGGATNQVGSSSVKNPTAYGVASYGPSQTSTSFR